MGDMITKLENDINRLEKNINNCEMWIIREENNINVFKKALHKKKSELRSLKDNVVSK